MGLTLPFIINDYLNDAALDNMPTLPNIYLLPAKREHSLLDVYNFFLFFFLEREIK